MQTKKRGQLPIVPLKSIAELPKHISDAEAEERLAAIYAQVQEVHCKGLCRACCGPIAMLPAETAHFRRRGIPLPIVGTRPGSLECSLLTDDGRCSVYSDRPLVCRLWGAIEGMRCPHGCLPESFPSVIEVWNLIESVRDITPGRPFDDMYYSKGMPDDIADIMRNATRFMEIEERKELFGLRSLGG